MRTNPKFLAMKCKEIHSKMWSFLEGELHTAEQKAMEEHLEVCPDCRSDLERLTVYFKLLEERKEMEINPYFFTRLQQALSDESIGPDPVIRRVPVLVRWVAMPLTLVVALFLGVTLITHSYWKKNLNATDNSLTMSPYEEFFLGDTDENFYDTYFLSTAASNNETQTP